MKILMNGLIKENPTFVLLLGMCPTLATTTSAINGLSMGLATMAVLVCTNFVISCIKKITPDMVRIPVFIVVIAAFVTILQMLMSAYAPDSINQALGIYIPLIVVNCIILVEQRVLLLRTHRLPVSLMVSAAVWVSPSVLLYWVVPVRFLVQEAYSVSLCCQRLPIF